MKKTALIINSKGSVGKTPTSFNLAYDLDMNIITNDKSVLIACYKDRTILTNQFELIENSLYDCGGFSAPGILNIVQQVNIVIVPVFNDPSSLIQTRDTLKQILPIAKKVIIVTTKTENKDADTIKNNLDKKYPGLDYFNLPLTKAFNHTLETGKSIKYLVETDKVYENWFGNFVQNNYIPFLNAVKKELEL
ncbi:P-loop NTPase family protein [Aliarcobacter butzleri]|uniref:hypothetical protein n=1 Tax=Aliarcobacter butzleri TaxID=28197 RepID=UPI0021B5EAB9|nr:hypothetical protein [Aliarcobacter butzleri]MCT7570639.1 hypothetical protein [Aliarcobacter butzleri]